MSEYSCLSIGMLIVLQVTFLRYKDGRVKAETCQGRTDG